MLNEALLNVLVEVNSSIVGLLPLAQTSECELVGDTDSLTPKERELRRMRLECDCLRLRLYSVQLLQYIAPHRTTITRRAFHVFLNMPVKNICDKL
uniref:NR LBD domain-containing protein n=1 Tax=Ascaris lumbricoides TaxID=6252 RepID=A0A0M3I457_ASCLU